MQNYIVQIITGGNLQNIAVSARNDPAELNHIPMAL